MRRSVRMVVFLLALVAAGPIAARAEAVADFYRGKTIKFLISAAAGGGYDVYARLMIRHLGRHIPGNPDFLPQNMPAAGGVALLNTAYNIGPFDGTMIFTLHFTLPLYQVIGGDGVRYDLSKMRGIGRLLGSNAVIGVGSQSKSGVVDFEGAKAKETFIGATGASSNSALYPGILNRMVGTKFKVVPGYQGEGNIFIAMERGEIDGFGSMSYLTFKSVKPHYLTEKLFHPIVQWGMEREEAWPDVPTAIDVAQTPVDKRAMQIVSAGPIIGFSYLMPQNVPEDRALALQAAFQAMIKDPVFLADAENAKLFLRTASAKEVEDMVAGVLSAPPDVVKRVIELTQP